MATLTEVMDELQAAGSEQTRKVYRKHGIRNEMFGVSYATLKALTKKIKRDHALALQLWATGNHDARVLATMIADPKQADEAMLDSWVRDLGNYTIADAVSGVFSKTAFARAKMEGWVESDDEWIGTVGWNLLSHLAMNDQTLPDSYFDPYLETIRRDIHHRRNRVRYAMNGALIAIGMRSDMLEAKAVEVGQAIGTVDVDHGETNCKTPDAVAYIQKAKARSRSL
jgi:3-methyladenine DNA glycosylase AlkD